jgi:hypothetical protein
MVICRRYERLAALCEAHARNLLCGARTTHSSEERPQRPFGGLSNSP